MKKIEEDAPTNAVAGGQVASVNPPSVDPSMPPVFGKSRKPILKRKILQSISNKKG